MYSDGFGHIMGGSYMIKGWIRAAVLMTLLCLSVSGCSYSPDDSDFKGENTESDDKIQLHLWGNQSLNEFSVIIQNFEKEHPDMKIVYHQYRSSDVSENLKLETNLLAGGSNVDVYFTYTTQTLSKRIKGKMAMDLWALCQRDGFDMEKNFTDNVTKFYYQGHPYAVPTTVGKMGIILNKDMFDAAGISVPRDWDFEEFRDICRRLTYGEGSEKVYGIFWNTRANTSESLLHLVLPTLGGDPLYKDGGLESNMDDPVICQALELLDATMNVDQSAPDYRESEIRKLSMEEMFFNGRCAMTVGAWLFESAIDSESYPHDFVTAFAPWPVIDKGLRNYTQGSFGGHLSINPNSQNVEAAWTFIKWYATKGCFENIACGYTPCFDGFLSTEVEAKLLSRADGLIDRGSALRVLLNPDTNLSIPVVENKIDIITEIFDSAVEDTLTGKMSAAEALARAKMRADRELKE